MYGDLLLVLPFWFRLSEDVVNDHDLTTVAKQVLRWASMTDRGVIVSHEGGEGASGRTLCSPKQPSPPKFSKQASKQALALGGPVLRARHPASERISKRAIEPSCIYFGE